MQEVQSLPKCAVILGAGASFDVWNGATPRNKDWQPPLVGELFRTGARQNFYDILRKHPGAVALGMELGPLAESGTLALEQKLREYMDHPDPRVRRQFRDVPPYLRELLSECSGKYVHVPGCYLQLIKRLLADHGHHVMFIVLNYDDLLEKALAAFHDSEFLIRSMDDYVAPDRQAKVVKIHGSINWLTPMGVSTREHVKRQQWLEQMTFDSPAKVVMLTSPGATALNVDGQAQFGYPVITAPLAGKDATNIVCPKEHRSVLGSFLRECRKLLVIGTSGLDQDLLHLLSRHLKTVPRLVHYVGGEDVADVRGRFEADVELLQGVAAEHFSGGFRRYLVTPDFERFAECAVLRD